MLFYETFGSGSSLNQPYPLIFLHGFLGSLLDWMPVIDGLKKKYRCIAIDLPSHGKSQDFSDPFKALEEALLSFGPSILVGYSLGGRLALKYGQQHPETIKSLIAISSHVGLQTSLEKEKRAVSDLVWEKRLNTLSCDDFLKLWYDQPVFSSLGQKPELLKALLKLRVYKNPKNLGDLLNAVSLAKQPFYHTFNHEVHFLFGEEDKSYENLYSSLPYPVKKIEKSGHIVHLENPERCIECIEEIAEKANLFSQR